MKTLFLGRVSPFGYQLSGNGAVSHSSGINLITDFRPNKGIKDRLNAASHP